MPRFLGGNTCSDKIGEIVVRAVAAKDVTSVPLFGGEKTVANLTFGGEAEAIAVAAERFRD